MNTVTKFKKLPHPWKAAVSTFAAILIATPFVSTAGIFAWIIQGSITRIADCVKTETRETCEVLNRWDSVSFANLIAYTFGGGVYAGLILGVISGSLSFRAAQPRIFRQVSLATQQRLQRAIEEGGLNLEDILESAGYK